MRRFVPPLTLFVAACATAPQQPEPQPAAVVTPAVHVGSDLLGLTAGELVQRFGNPALQIREGAGLKLQFRRRGCVLDAYLYASGGSAVERVSHVDARYPTGADMNQQSCISVLQSP